MDPNPKKAKVASWWNIFRQEHFLAHFICDKLPIKKILDWSVKTHVLIKESRQTESQNAYGHEIYVSEHETRGAVDKKIAPPKSWIQFHYKFFMMNRYSNSFPSEKSEAKWLHGSVTSLVFGIQNERNAINLTSVVLMCFHNWNIFVLFCLLQYVHEYWLSCREQIFVFKIEYFYESSNFHKLIAIFEKKSFTFLWSLLAINYWLIVDQTV